MKGIFTPEPGEQGLTTFATGNSALQGSEDFADDIARDPSQLYFGMKRLIDVALAILGIVALTPIFLAVAVCIKLEDGGSIVFFREMIGLNGRSYKIFKFRTMIPEAEAYLEQHPELKLEYQKNMKLQYDPRITRLGRFLRKTYLDELPQLFNVLAGHMSLVGPRSLPAHELTLYGEYAQKRLTVKPGITGLWQISETKYTTYDERIPLDMEYIDSRSLFLDFVILLKTLKVLIAFRGV